MRWFLLNFALHEVVTEGKRSEDIAHEADFFDCKSKFQKDVTQHQNRLCGLRVNTSSQKFFCLPGFAHWPNL